MSLIDSILGVDVVGVHDADGWLLGWTDAGRRTAAGVSVTAGKALSCSAWFAAMRAISEDIAKLPFITYRRLPGGGKERVPEHPMYPLLHDAPNDEMGSMNWRESQTHHAIGWGGGYAEIERGGAGQAIALWPIHASRVAPKRDAKKRIFYRIKADDIIGEPVDIPARNMLCIHGLGPTGLRGYFLHVLAKEGLGVSLEAEKYAGSFFGNGATPGGVLQHPGVLGDKALEHLRRTWNEMHQGSMNAHKPAILEEDMKWEQIGIEPEKAMMIATRQFQVEDIARWFRMPPHKIQHLLRSTFSNIEHQSMEYVVDTLMPWTVRWEQEAKRKLFPKEPDIFAEHLFAALLRGDSKQRAEFYNKMFQVSALNPDEIRELENMNPLPDGAGKKYYVMSNMTPADQAGQPPARPGGQAKKQAPPAEPAPEDENPFGALALRAHVPVFEDAAQRVIAKETRAAARAAKKYDGDPAGFATWAHGFYAEHRGYVADALMPAAISLASLLAPGGGQGNVGVAVREYAVFYTNMGRQQLEAAYRDGNVDGWGKALADIGPDQVAEAVMDLICGTVKAGEAKDAV